jgi:hypothetical protein
MHDDAEQREPEVHGIHSRLDEQDEEADDGDDGVESSHAVHAHLSVKHPFSMISLHCPDGI